MGSAHKSVVLVCLAVLLIGIPILNAQWVENGIPICTAVDNQDLPDIVSDGVGGAIIVWEDERSGLGYDIYAQRITGEGYTRWTLDGAAVCTQSSEQEFPAAVTDMSGGAIIAWWDFRSANGDIYAQRIDSTGVIQWAAEGVPVCTLSEYQYLPQLISDGSGGAIITWADYRSGSDNDVYAQRIDSDGNAVWTSDGVGVSTVAEYQTDPLIVSDGVGGAIIAWLDNRTEVYHVYAQRLDANGTPQWTADGNPICTVAGFKSDMCMISDGAGGAIIGWYEDRAGDQDVYLQRVSSNGVVQWTPDGVIVDDTDFDDYRPRFILNSDDDIILTWEREAFGGYEFSALVQKMNLNGEPLWSPGGISICPGYWMTFSPQVISDDLGGAVIVYLDWRTEDYIDAYAQRINKDGLNQWALTGAPVCVGDYDIEEFKMIPDGRGGMIMTWHDHRNGQDYDVYALRLNRAGRMEGYYPAPNFTAIEDVPKDQGGRLDLRWQRSEADTMPNTEITHYSLWRLKPYMGASPLAVEELGSLEELGITADFDGTAMRYLPLAQGYTWEWLDNVPARHEESYGRTVESLYDSMGTDPGWQYFVVTAHTNDPLIYFDSPVDSGYSVDNLSPAQPTGFAGIQSLAPEGLRLSWLPNTESDLSHYSIHRGDDEFFVPDGSNRVGTTADTVLIDTAWIATDYYFYKISAVDVHGNASPEALLRPEDIIVETLLQSFAAALIGDYIEVSWTLSEAGEGVKFHVLKARGETGTFAELLEPSITADGLSFTFRDRDTEPGETYRYRVEVEDEEGRRVLFETEPVTTPVMALTLYQNHPNPFNPSTTIRYYLPESGHVVLDIYDTSGRRVVRLVDGKRDKGIHTVDWNGCDKHGTSMASGVYFYRLSIGKEAISKKMILLR